MQPNPIPNDSRPLWELVIEDMKERDQVGRERYGTPLQVGNGRNPAQDAYEESLDQTVYLKQLVIERQQMQEENRQLRVVLNELIRLKGTQQRFPISCAKLFDEWCDQAEKVLAGNSEQAS